MDSNITKNQTVDKKEEKKSSDYFAKLKGLNECVAQWIKAHVDSNPFCILTPVFQDYEKHLKEIESKNEKSELESTGLRNKFDNSPLSKNTKTPEKKPEKSVFNPTTPSIFGASKTTSVSSNVFSNPSTETNPFFNKPSASIESDETQSFVCLVTQPSTLTTATFSFGQSSTNNVSAGFSFGR